MLKKKVDFLFIFVHKNVQNFRYISLFTFILGIVTVGGLALACIKQLELFLIKLLVMGIPALPIGPVIKSHLRASITIITTFFTTGLYNSFLFIL